MPANESSASFLFLFSRIRDALFTSCELIFMRCWETGVWGPSNCSPGFNTASEPAVSWHWLKHLCDKACALLDPNWCPNKSKNKATTKEVPMPPPKTAHSFLSPGSWMHMKLCSLDQGWGSGGGVGEWHSLLGWRLHSERMDFPQLLVVSGHCACHSEGEQNGVQKREQRDAGEGEACTNEFPPHCRQYIHWYEADIKPYPRMGHSPKPVRGA